MGTQTCLGRVYHLWPNVLGKVVSGMVPVYLGTVRMSCGSNLTRVHMNHVRNHRAQTKECVTVVFHPKVKTKTLLNTIDVEVEKSARWSLL